MLGVGGGLCWKEILSVTQQSNAVLRIRIQDPVPFRPPDLGSRIPNLFFESFMKNFLGKKFCNSL
jgi:hypothetical protein